MTMPIELNDTNQTSAEQAIQDQLRRLKWMIPDAMRRMDEAAQCMLRRAQGAVNSLEKSRLIRLMVSQIEFNAKDTSISVTFYPDAIRSLKVKRKDDAV